MTSWHTIKDGVDAAERPGEPVLRDYQNSGNERLQDNGRKKEGKKYLEWLEFLTLSIVKWDWQKGNREIKEPPG